MRISKSWYEMDSKAMSKMRSKIKLIEKRNMRYKETSHVENYKDDQTC